MSTKQERKLVYNTKRWRALRLEVMSESNWQCSKCGRAAKDVHHIRPMSRGGAPWDRSNLEAICRACHAAAHTEHKPPVPDSVTAWRGLVNAMRS